MVGRIGLLGEHAPSVLARLSFFVLSPCLLFTVLGDAEVHVLFSSLLLVSAIAAVSAFALYALIAGVIWRRPIAEVTVGALGSGYVNANNIGIPVAAYVLGDAAFSAPVVLLQLLVFAPIALTVLDVQERGQGIRRPHPAHPGDESDHHRLAARGARRGDRDRAARMPCSSRSGSWARPPCRSC